MAYNTATNNYPSIQPLQSFTLLTGLLHCT